MTQHPHPDDLPAFALGALDPTEMHAIDAHLAACACCRAIVRDYSQVTRLLLYAAPPHDLPEHLKAQLLRRVAAAAESCTPTVVAFQENNT